VTETEAVRFYRAVGPYGFLSNLHRCRVELDGVEFSSAEHAYQYGKPKTPPVREWIRAAPLPRHAALAGHHLSTYDVVEGWSGPTDAPWKGAKVERMERVVEAKFRQNADLAAKLLATGRTQLIEESPDGFWGEGRWANGHNMLGHILMGVRDKLRAEEP
jgi:ribA/ribD-fused uncharacterized protein